MLPLFDNVPTRRFPVVTVSLIAANFAVWLWELGARDQRIGALRLLSLRRARAVHERGGGPRRSGPRAC